MRLHVGVAALIVCCLTAAAYVSHGQAWAAGPSECAEVENYQHEVCVAYVANATYGARVPYYKLGRSQAPGYYRAAREDCVGRILGRAAYCRVASRYYGAARRFLRRQTSRWPARVRVSPPSISILRVQVDRAANSAVVVTRENWRVTDRHDRVLFAETRKRHTIRMRSVGGLLTRKWVVAGIG